jgi:hypothetical protein
VINAHYFNCLPEWKNEEVRQQQEWVREHEEVVGRIDEFYETDVIGARTAWQGQDQS